MNLKMQILDSLICQLMVLIVMATVKACDLFFKNVYTVHENKQKPNAKK